MTSSCNVFGLYSHRWAICAATLCLIVAFTQQVQAKTFRCEEGDVACLIAAINRANANGHKDARTGFSAEQITPSWYQKTSRKPSRK